MKFCFAFIHDPGTFHSKKKLLAADRREGPEGAAGDEHDRPDGDPRSAAPTCRLRRPRRATRSSAASPTRSPSRGGRSSCSASTRSVTYHMDVPLYTTPFVWVMNKDKYESMSAAQKKVIDDHCTTEWAEKVGLAVGRFRVRRPGQARRPGRTRRLQADADAARRVAQGGRADRGAVGRGRHQGRLRPEAGDGLAEEHGREVQGRLLSATRRDATTRAGAAPPARRRWIASSMRSSGAPRPSSASSRLNIFLAVVLRKFFSLADPRQLRHRQDAARHADLLGHRRDQLSRRPHHGRSALDRGERALEALHRRLRDDRAALRRRGADDHAVRQGARHLRRPRAHLRPQPADLAVLRRRLARRRLGGGADRDPHLPAGVPSGAAASSRRSARRSDE